MSSGTCKRFTSRRLKYQNYVLEPPRKIDSIRGAHLAPRLPFCNESSMVDWLLHDTQMVEDCLAVQRLENGNHFNKVGLDTLLYLQFRPIPWMYPMVPRTLIGSPVTSKAD